MKLLDLARVLRFRAQIQRACRERMNWTISLLDIRPEDRIKPVSPFCAMDVKR